MAANLHSRGLASFGRLFVSQIRSPGYVVSPSLSISWWALNTVPCDNYLPRKCTCCQPFLVKRSVLYEASCGKRWQVWRAVHVSVYDKNREENVQPTVVPDNVIPPQPEQYWAPHPRTGVFGPAKDEKPASGGVPVNASADSVLEQKAFFRPLEDLDKPVQP